MINSYAPAQLAMRTGATSTLIPNVMDFEHAPDLHGDEYAAMHFQCRHPHKARYDRG